MTSYASWNRGLKFSSKFREGVIFSAYKATHGLSRVPRRLFLPVVSSYIATQTSTVAAAPAAYQEQSQQFSPLDKAFFQISGPPTYISATGRIVAIGDLHGDLRKAIKSLRLAGVLYLKDDETPIWCGGDTVVVQMGDVLDRGDNEIAIVMLLRELDRQARLEGGAIYMLNGNHESLNICGDYRYVTEGAFLESSLAAGLSEEEAGDLRLRREARSALYSPGGPMAVEFSKNPTVLVVNDTAFAHGGLLPMHVKYGIERMNREVSAWMRGDQLPDGGRAMPPYLAMGDGKSVMWNRTLSREAFGNSTEKYTACTALFQALEHINAKRLVVGHTPQLGGCNCECGGRVWRVDVGMSVGVLDANVQVLQIGKTEDGSYKPDIRILTEKSLLSTWGEDEEDSEEIDLQLLIN